MDYEHVLYEKQGAIIRITMNRPEKLNAMDFPGQGGLLDQFYEALSEAEDDDVGDGEDGEETAEGGESKRKKPRKSDVRPPDDAV